MASMISKDPGMREINLDDLTQYSPWPARLLGLENWGIPTRDTTKTEQEYNRDHYARCLRYFSEAVQKPTPEDVRRFQYEIEGFSSLDSTVCVSSGDRLYLTRLSSALGDINRIMTQTMSAAIAEASTVIELGSGYGYFLWMLSQHFPDKAWRGGDYSMNAVRLSRQLFGNRTDIRVVQMDFYEPETYKFIQECASPIVVFTARSIEQLPESACVFNALGECSRKVGDVFHFEPVYELYSDTLLGLMRRRYTQVNDYNRDLLSQLRSRPSIRIVEVKEDVVGIPPLNPMCVIHWRFVQ